MSVRSFIDHHYRHFNAAALKDAAQGYEKHLAGGGKMMVTLAGAMSTAERIAARMTCGSGTMIQLSVGPSEPAVETLMVPVPVRRSTMPRVSITC